MLAPDAIPVERLRRAGAPRAKLFLFPGLKEDYYLADFGPDPAVLERAGHRQHERVVVVVRPPPETSAYHADEPALRATSSTGSPPTPASHAVVIPRTDDQAKPPCARAATPSLIVPDRAIDAQSLIAYADLVVSAGGTMNREAVALGTPVYTIFSGRHGRRRRAADRAGRLRPLDDPGTLELEQARATARRARRPATLGSSSTRVLAGRIGP